MNQKIKVGLVGVTGYTGMELLRLLLLHPDFELALVTSRQEEGKKLQDIFPNLQGYPEAGLTICSPVPEEIAQNCSLVFLAVPHGQAMNLAAQLLDRGLKVVDFSADFRLSSVSVYEKWYHQEHSQNKFLDQAVYGLIEIYQNKIRQARLIANPGCYPTSVILPVFPALRENWISPESIVIDSKSGATGAGRGAKVNNLFCEVSDNFKAYNLGKHRHTPEIEQELSLAANKEITVSFNPHLLPLNRGILSTIYTKPIRPVEDCDQIRQAYKEYYNGFPWIRILDEGLLPEVRWVRGTMFCDIGFVLDKRSGQLIIVSAIDNLCRGASGQALANANLMTGLEVSKGLDCPALMP